MAVPKNLLKALSNQPKAKPKSKAVKAAKKKGKKAKNMDLGRREFITKAVNEYDGPVRPSERLDGPHSDEYQFKRPTSLEQEIYDILRDQKENITDHPDFFEGLEEMEADDRYDMVNKYIEKYLLDGSVEDGFDPDAMAEFGPMSQLAIRRHLDGKDIYPPLVPDHIQYVNFAMPRGADFIEAGDQVIPFTPKELDEVKFGKDAANQILQNLLERNDSTSQQQFGMPVIGKNAEGYTSPSLWHGLVDAQDVEAFALPGYGYARGRFSERNFDPFQRTADIPQHEAKHLALQHRSNPEAKVRPDIDKYAKNYILEQRLKKAAEDYGIDTSNKDWFDEMPEDLYEEVYESIPHERDITAGNYPEEIPRTTWLNNQTAEGGVVSQGTLEDMNSWDHYINNPAELMVETAVNKHERAYANGVEGRDNTFKGDMKILEDMIKNPRNQSEAGFGKIRNALNPEEQKQLDLMFWRLGENKQPNLKKALMS